VPSGYTASPRVTTVPARSSSRSAVAESPFVEHDEMSPAARMTADSDGGLAGTTVPGAALAGGVGDGPGVDDAAVVGPLVGLAPVAGPERFETMTRTATPTRTATATAIQAAEVRVRLRLGHGLRDPQVAARTVAASA
jgi:hypothetical protein